MKAVRWTLAALLVLTSNAFAAYTVYVYESGGNVIANGSGSLNLAGVAQIGGVASTVSLVAPGSGLLYTGIAGNAVRYGAAAGPTAFGAAAITSANASSGNLVGIQGVLSRFFVPQGYISGSPLTSSAVWNTTTLAALGLTPGTYTWTWASDSYTLKVGIAPPGPVPASIPTLSEWALMVLSLALLALAWKHLSLQKP